MTPPRLAALAAALSLSAACTTPRATAQASPRSAPIFVFHTDESWLGLHHFLYVLGRARNGESDAAREAVAGAPKDEQQGIARLTATEQQAWRDAVAFYAAGPSKKDLIFDDSLVATAKALVKAGDAPSLGGVAVDRAAAAVLERAMPAYRKAWWPTHRAANVAWRSDTQASLDRYGRPVIDLILKWYALRWPAGGYPIHLSGYANWAGAYSVTGNILVISSLESENRGSTALETVFHEAMHQWDDSVFARLRVHTGRLGKRVPNGLSHALIFYTAGEAVRRVVPGHVPFAEAGGIWNRGLASFRAPLERTWKPYLDGKTTLDEALAALVAATVSP
jgi:hypothetical protein